MTRWRGTLAGMLAAALVLGGASAASAMTPPADLGAAAPLPTTIQGWRTSTRTVEPKHVLRDGIRVTGADRQVRLERRVGSSWKVEQRTTTDAAGWATIAWTLPKSGGAVVLRIHVLHTERYLGAVSKHRTLTVSGAEGRRVQLLAAVNRARATARSCGRDHYAAVPALRRSAALDRAAQGWAVRMAKEGFFAHEKGSSNPGTRLAAVGIRNVSWAENIAAGQPDVKSVMAAWLESPGHCADIMDPHVRRVGFGYLASTTAKYRTYWVQDFAG